MKRNINEGFETVNLKMLAEGSEKTDQILQAELHKAGDFEFYFGVEETPENLQQVTINRELFFAIYLKDSKTFIGYLGFSPLGNAWEAEIYIIKQYRGQGYGTEALKGALDQLFSGQWVIMKNGKRQKLMAECVKSTVRVQNTASRRMMEKIGFQTDENIACCFMLGGSDELGMIEVVEYVLTKDE